MSSPSTYLCMDSPGRTRYAVRHGEHQQGRSRVIRGGSWNNNAKNVRAAYRNDNQPDNRNNNLGFRLARAHEHSAWMAGLPVTRCSSRLSVSCQQQKRKWTPVR